MPKKESFEKKVEKRIEEFGEEVEELGKKASTKVRQTFSGEKEFKNVPRLYRSGKEKILGGVCGGIAEYLKVDPVLIRLLWIMSVFVWGAGILVYLIAWIIIPRNPKHKWNS